MYYDQLNEIYTKKQKIIIPRFLKSNSLDTILSHASYALLMILFELGERMFSIVFSKIRGFDFKHRFFKSFIDIIQVIIIGIMLLTLAFLLVVMGVIFLVLFLIYIFCNAVSDYIKSKKPTSTPTSIDHPTHTEIFTEKELQELYSYDTKLVVIFNNLTSDDICKYAQEYIAILPKLYKQLDYSTQHYNYSSDLRKIKHVIKDYKALLGKT